MTDRLDSARILIYSHDTFGLGHLRRCRTIAHSLVDRYKGLSVLILSGSPIVGSFDYRARVDFIRIPGVIKLHNGDYTSLGLHINLEQTMAMRESIIRHTAEIFDPDIFLVDKEPLGLKGEVEKTLRMFKPTRTRLVLGLREVMDDPELLKPEWERKGAMPALEELYDEIWVYGPLQTGNPLDGLDLPTGVSEKMAYAGYLRRDLPAASGHVSGVDTDEPYLLVTPGGGGDGEQMVDWVLSAYEQADDLPYPAIIVFGPFMQASLRQTFQHRADALSRVQAIDFDNQMERLMEGAEGVVAMGGYNTFCEILSLNKRALLIPRVHPRREQLIRAQKAQDLGLARMLPIDSARAPEEMIAALRTMPSQSLPSDVAIPGLLDGLDNVARFVGETIAQPQEPDVAATV